MSDVMIKI
jgi:hypothetical protein